MRIGKLESVFALTMPYGKFVHIIYRYARLVRNRQEEILEMRPTPAER